MRIKEPEYGAFRVVKRFALFPIEAGHELVWLEKCYILQRYSRRWGYWQNVSFTTKEEYIAEREAEKTAVKIEE